MFWSLWSPFAFQKTYYSLFLEGWRLKKAIFQKILHLENVIFELFGCPGGSPSEKILPKMVQKGQSLLILKSLCLLSFFLRVGSQIGLINFLAIFLESILNSHTVVSQEEMLITKNRNNSFDDDDAKFLNTFQIV